MLGRLRITLRHGLCALALALLVPGTAHAGLTTPPLAVDGSLDAQFAAPDAGSLEAGAADGGDVVAAWRDEGAATTPIKLLLWRGGASAPEVVSPGLGGSPDVAMAPGGHALASWVGSDGRVWIARRAPGGSWLSPTPVDPPPLGGGDESRWWSTAVALRGDGSAVVAAAGCVDYVVSAENALYAIDVGADGAIGAAQKVSGTEYSTLGCFSGGTPRAAAGPGGRDALTFCISLTCRLATRASAGAGWVGWGVDGTQYGNNTGGAVPVVAPSGAVVVAYRGDNPAPSRVRAAIGTSATSMTQLPELSDGGASSAPAEPFVYGNDVLALYLTEAPSGGVQVLSRPIFAAGSLGAVGELAARSFLGDVRGAAWPDGTSVIALNSQPAADASPQLALLRRSLAGALTPIDTTPLPGRAVTLPRVAVAGSAAQPLGVVATREAPIAGGGPAAIVLRRIDGVAPALALGVPAGADAGRAVSLTATTSDASAPVAVTWLLGDGTTAQGTAISHAYATAGTRTVTAVATDLAGNTTTATATIVVADRTSPQIAGARLTATRFRVARRATALVARRAPAGTTVRLTLSESASLRITVVRPRAGHRVRGRCRVAAPRGRRCVVRRSVATLRRELGAGPAAIPFSGRLGRRALQPGRYELRLVATDAAGNAGRPVVLRFRIVR